MRRLGNTVAKAWALAASLAAVLPGAAPAAAPPGSPAEQVALQGCFGCHADPVVRFFERAPSLDGAAERLRPGWVQRFLEDPGTWQPHGRMPRLDLTPGERADLQAFLMRDDGSSAQVNGTASTAQPPAPLGGADRGRRLYEQNRCATCHEEGQRALALERVADKLQPGWLRAFLLDPGPAMPDYALSPGDAADLTAYLLQDARPLSVTPGASPRGERLFLRHGCAACHPLSRLEGRPMAELLRLQPPRRWHDFDLEPLEEVLRGWLVPGQDAAPTRRPRPADGNQVGPADDAFWQLPVPPQGEPPAAWSGLERSLDPAACGVCHPTQYLDWSTSLHARATSPGFRAEMAAAVDQVAACRTCHAPLSEQETDPGLRAQGVVCASCHVRGHRRQGPQDRLGGRPVTAHGGARHDLAFGEARFCARCHQSGPGDRMPGGKFIMDVVREWEAGPAAAAGRPCQECHMPGRRHLWRGIHDPDMVREALQLEIDTAARPVQVRLTNAGAGHAVPTYVVPRIVLAAWAEDEAGVPFPGTELRWELGRELTPGLDMEIWDTRLGPGETRSYPLDVELPPDAVRVVASLDVFPDYLYERLYASRLARDDLEPATRELYRQAHDRPLVPPYRARLLRGDL